MNALINKYFAKQSIAFNDHKHDTTSIPSCFKLTVLFTKYCLDIKQHLED